MGATRTPTPTTTTSTAGSRPRAARRGRRGGGPPCTVANPPHPRERASPSTASPSSSPTTASMRRWSWCDPSARIRGWRASRRTSRAAGVRGLRVRASADTTAGPTHPSRPPRSRCERRHPRTRWCPPRRRSRGARPDGESGDTGDTRGGQPGQPDAVLVATHNRPTAGGARRRIRCLRRSRRR